MKENVLKYKDERFVEQQNWKAFDKSTEAGRLLARLYGVSPGSRSSITYPKIKTKKSEHTSDWKVATNANSNNEKCLIKATHMDKSKSIKVPKMGRCHLNHQGKALVDIIPKRKQAHKCKEEISKIKERMNAYRPPNRSNLAEAEKIRLNDIFCFTGGSALPVELTHPKGITPEEEAWKQNEKSRVEKVNARRRTRLCGLHESEISKSSSFFELKDTEERDPQKAQVKQIMNEIEERRLFQLQMEEANCGAQTRKSIASEISSRILQLKRLDPDKAEAIMYNV